MFIFYFFFFFSSRRRHTRCSRDWSSDVCSSDLLLMAMGNPELENAQQPHAEQEREEGDDAYVHCSSKNSALKPGPKAAASAYSPGFKGRFSSHSWRIKRIVALDRLPTLPRMSHDGCVWHFVRPRAVSTLPSRRAPPGCRIHPLIS